MRPVPEHVDAVVLAGGVNRIALFEGYTPGYKALIPFHDKPAIRYTLEALCATPRVSRICIVGSEADLGEAVQSAAASGPAIEFVPGGQTLVGSIVAGLEHFADSPAVLIATADIPLITPEVIHDFLCAASRVETEYEHTLLMSVVPAHSFTGVWAANAKGFNRFRDVKVCHGNVMLADPALLRNEDAMGRINQMYGQRKSQLRSAMAIGWRVGVSYVVGVQLLHALTLERMARIASWRFNIGLIPVMLERPEVAVDVDEAADYAFVQAELARRAEGAAACV